MGELNALAFNSPDFLCVLTVFSHRSLRFETSVHPHNYKGEYHTKNHQRYPYVYEGIPAEIVGYKSSSVGCDHVAERGKAVYYSARHSRESVILKT